MALGAENLIYFPFSATLYQRQGQGRHFWTLEADRLKIKNMVGFPRLFNFVSRMQAFFMEIDG